MNSGDGGGIIGLDLTNSACPCCVVFRYCVFDILYMEDSVRLTSGDGLQQYIVLAKQFKGTVGDGGVCHDKGRLFVLA